MSARVHPHLHRGRGAGALLFSVGLLFAMVVSPVPVGAAGMNGRIAMRCVYDICTVDPDGTGLKVLTTGYEPDWSPDGRLIVFVWGGDGKDGELATVRADGSHYKRLTRNDVDDRFPEFSPDGKRIAFSCGAQICWMNADGSHRTKITSAPGWAEDPSWAPSGDALAFTGDTDDLYGIYTIALDGSTPLLVSPGPADKSPSWSPNGRRIAFVHGAGLVTMFPDGTGLKELTSTQTGVDAAPVWSPDSRQVAYAHADPDDDENDPPFFTYTVKRDGMGITQVSDEFAYWVGQLSWTKA